MTQQKRMWFDLETTGIDPTQNGIHQLAGLIESDGVIVEEFNLLITPPKDKVVEPEALACSGLTEKDIIDQMSYPDAHSELKGILKTYCNPYDRTDKFVLAGYNINAFDDPFLRRMFLDCKDVYYGSWFFWPKLDVQTSVAEWIYNEAPELKNYQLGTICEWFGIEIDAHDALSDVKATKALYEAINERIDVR